MSDFTQQFQNSVVKSRQANDHLSLRMCSSVRKVLKKYEKGNDKEVVQFSDFIVKINPKGKPQERVLLVTNRAVYNLLPTDYGKCKRRVDLLDVASITVSMKSDEFVVHVPCEYDYRLMSLRKREIIECLRLNYKEYSESVDKAALLPIGTSNKPILKDICTTKAQAKKLRKAAGKRSSPPTPLDNNVVNKQGGEVGGGGGGSGGSGGSGGGANRTQQNEVDPFLDDAPQRKRAMTTTWSGKETNVGPDDFELIKVIGRGSFGKVMMVRKNDGSPKVYAMKILRKKAIIERNQVEHTKAEREILEEVDHPFLMKLHFAFQTPTKLYLVMDMITGGELFFHLKNERRFKEPRARLYTAEILLGLGHLHSLDVIYRDLKPENILLDDEGHVKLTDFGLSKKFTTPGEKAQTFCGTPEYLAPEVVNGIGHDKGVDWWSLGILLYEMLVGLPPFYSENTNLMYDLIQKADLRIPGFVSNDAKELLRGLLQLLPENRLGYGPKDCASIQTTPFFSSLNWDDCIARKIQPEFVPQVRGDTDVQFFDKEFTNEKVVDSVVPTSRMGDTAKAADEFGGFTFEPQGKMGPR